MVNVHLALMKSVQRCYLAMKFTEFHMLFLHFEFSVSRRCISCCKLNRTLFATQNSIANTPKCCPLSVSFFFAHSRSFSKYFSPSFPLSNWKCSTFSTSKSKHFSFYFCFYLPAPLLGGTKRFNIMCRFQVWVSTPKPILNLIRLTHSWEKHWEFLFIKTDHWRYYQ